MIKWIIKLFESPEKCHQWQNWSEPFQRTKNSIIWYQRRKCSLCNLTQERIIGLDDITRDKYYEN